MSTRLTSSLLVSAMMRRVAQEGGNAVVVVKGDPNSGAILLICCEKSILMSFRERLLDVGGTYTWAVVGPKPDADFEQVESWLARRRSLDPDLWIVELDIPNAERFAAETSPDC